MRRRRDWKRGSERRLSMRRSALICHADVPASFLVGLFQELERLVLVREPGVDGRDQIGRDIPGARIPLQVTKELHGLDAPADRRKRVRQRRDRVLIAMRHLHGLLILGNGLAALMLSSVSRKTSLPQTLSMIRSRLTSWPSLRPGDAGPPWGCAPA
jgi:hypothetical protein